MVLCGLSLTLSLGCGPQPPDRGKFSGEVLTEVPDVPGANEAYLLPELEEKPSSSNTESSSK